MNNTQQASASSIAIENDNNIMSLSHNQLQLVFDSLSLSDILNMRLLSSNMNEQVKLYLKNVYLPKHFSGFNQEQENTSIEQLQKRQTTLNMSSILNQDNIKSLQNLISSHSELVQNTISCYNLLESELFVYDKGTNQQVLNVEKFVEFSNKFDINALSSETYKQLTEQVQKFNMQVVTPQMRQVGLMVRTFSQLAMNFQFQAKLKSAKLRVNQYKLIQNIVQAL